MSKLQIEECDIVRLKDGREGTVLGIWADGEAYEIELDPPELETIKKEEIEKIIYKA
ncbi:MULTISPECIES: DUF4926 domain-containing protein [Clostridium]|jgi:hypothetical protein|uniref:DUF4926 domain-containing protein n=1 Tax=Clostridium tertium TaxID=1559 RepID=A0A9X3XR58_9CLOT|nr:MULTISPECIES: DUF4926 domain-containing protein [Clostridium]MBP1868783.1 hypothetical protein [Clostridium tertium]MBS5886689.1 hypothetical protein [Clostridium sp.]MDB1969432.1 hypothetical protein [Clostridium tertium]MDC4242639.1 hypothetical protein [Clostridium tertium]